ncbi:MAG: Phospholipase/carboxylesterase family protein [Myxococcaceae bacterium]|nr:Phospholipase/carboxylesterase family protein [Myxococcaceae bacterium]
MLAVLMAASCSRSVAEAPRPLQFVERVTGGADPSAALPLVIALHGLGDTPEQFVALFAELNVPARIIAPRAPDPWQTGTSWFPIDDADFPPAGILQRAALVTTLADQLQKTRHVRGLPIVTGFSQGGILSYAISAFHADHFAAAIPVAGALFDGMPPFRKAPKSFRVIAFHGEQDNRVPFAADLRTVEQLKKVGTDVSLTGIAGLGHSLPPTLIARWHAALRDQLQKTQ